jgi:chromate transporter
MRPQLPARSTTPLSTRRRTSLRELALLYLKLGATAMGGPAAHIAMMEEEVVDRRRWLTRDEFLDFLGAANVIPGPSSTEMAIHVGRVRAGWPGLVVAGVSFILPASLMVGSLAGAYVRFGALPRIAASLYAVKPVVIVVIAQGAIRLARSAIKSTGLAVLGAMSVLAAALGLDALFTLFAAGVVAGCVHLARTLRNRPSTVAAAGAVSAAGVAVPFRLGLMSLVFLKIGATLFGGRLRPGGSPALRLRRPAALAHRATVAGRRCRRVGSPGPLFTTATFIGYVLGGPAGAVLATIAIFLPAFVFVALSRPLVGWLRRCDLAGAVLDGIKVAAIALMIVVSAQLARTAVVDGFTLGIAAVSALLLFCYRVNSTWLVVGAAVAGELVIWLGLPAFGRP